MLIIAQYVSSEYSGILNYFRISVSSLNGDHNHSIFALYFTLHYLVFNIFTTKLRNFIYKMLNTFTEQLPGVD